MCLPIRIDSVGYWLLRGMHPFHVWYKIGNPPQYSILFLFHIVKMHRNDGFWIINWSASPENLGEHTWNVSIILLRRWCHSPLHFTIYRLRLWNVTLRVHFLVLWSSAGALLTSCELNYTGEMIFMLLNAILALHSRVCCIFCELSCWLRHCVKHNSRV